MHRLRSVLALLLTQAVACQPVPTSTGAGDSAAAPASPFRASAPGAEVLVFPPPLAAEARRALPRRLAQHEQTEEVPTDVEWPYLDADRRFDVEGQTVQIHFNRQIAPPAEGVTALGLEPAVAGTTTWPSPWVLSFRADAPFDPDTEYTVRLGELYDGKGKRVAEGWTGVFTAEPRISIASKVITYLPEPGKPRVVVVRPGDGSRVGRRVAPRVLFDQPVSVAQASALVSAEVDGSPRALVLRHPEKDRFDGVAVDRHHVVVARPRTPLRHGQSLSFTVTDPEGRSDSQALTVAPPLEFSEVDCASDYGDEDCTWKDRTLELEGGRLFVRFNNPLSTTDPKKLARLVTVTPPVKGLRVTTDSWREDGVLRIAGEFSPSTRYRVKVARVRDRYGSSLKDALRFAVKVAPLSASVSMPEGNQVLDEQASRDFEVTTRNVKEAELLVWEVEPDPDAFAEARERLGARERPTRAPDLKIPVRPRARRDAAVTTRVDLLGHLEPGKTYLTRVELKAVAFGAKPPSYPEWSMAARPPTALVTPHDGATLAVHVHSSGDKSLLHVARLRDGKPVRGATFSIDGTRVAGLRTGVDGVAVLTRALDPRAGGGGHHVLEVEARGGRATLALGAGTLSERELAPELGGGSEPLDDIRAFLISDRGVYRPGAQVELKGIVQFSHRGRLRAASTMPVGVRIKAPTGQQVFSEDGLTGEVGGLVTRFSVPADAEIGRYRVQLVAPLRDDAVLASYGIQVAEFEPPRFTVDVEARAEADGRRLQASVAGRYLFGAAMEDAPVTWTLRRQPAAFPRGPLVAGGFEFRRVHSWWDDEGEDEAWLRTGEGALDPEGTLTINPAVELDPGAGPQRFSLEAEVTDQSHRAIAGRGSVVLHPAPRYAGLKLAERWLDVGQALPLEVGVIDQAGATVPGAPVTITLESLDWKEIRRPGPGGWADVQWRELATTVATCTVTGRDTSGCKLVPRDSGSYRVSVAVDGRRGGSTRLWAWRYGDGGSTALPSPGRRLEAVADRDRYRPGDVATLMVRNPFPSATAILTVEQGGLLHHETRTLTGSAARFEVPITAEHAPYAHATVTLLPQGAKGEARVDWKLAAIRLPVALEDVALDVVVASDRDRYEPGDEVEIVIDVSRGTTPVEGAEVALAVVDEGVLRLTNFHATNPVPQLYPGQGLRLWVDDSRRHLAEQLRRSHAAGDGSGAGSHSLVSTRKDFVKTALWAPALRTDDQGRAHARFTLPDNLTRFRMMAVVVDAEGRGGVHEDDFEVQKPLMIIPAVPRFAAVGDRFEAAVMVHNNQAQAEAVTVRLGEHAQRVEIPAEGRRRVAFERAPDRPGELALEFSVADAEGTVRDRVEARLPVQAPGIDERPRMHGSFLGRQRIALEIPEGTFTDATADEHLTVTVGENLWPELGSRLEYLIDYPHGCVEQTTSSTLPLLAARDILPRLGLTRFGDDQLRDMIAAGVERLSTMRTSAGGLAYWPGGSDPNPFGTAYASLAIARARQIGIEPPEGMVEGMVAYLERMLRRSRLPRGYGEEVRASMALALAELEALPPSAADALHDSADEQGIFGLATLALALSTLEGQEDRVAALLDELEGSFDAEGELSRDRGEDFLYFGSDRRSAAQAAIALARLRPSSAVLPALVHRLVRRTPGYTTQSTAYGLLALAERIRDNDGEPARQRARLDGIDLMPELSAAVALGPHARRYRIPLAQLRGRRVMLTLESESDRAQSFTVSARWRRPTSAEGNRAATTTPHGPDLYRVITDAKGRKVDFGAIEAGQVLRVVLLARLPEDLPYERRGFLALTDRLPAGFEAMQPDLWTVASVPELDRRHPLFSHLRWSGSTASHVELRDDRAHFYFDRLWGEWVHATYLMRATTPGEFTAPPAMAELMYEPDSAGYSQAQAFTVTP